MRKMIVAMVAILLGLTGCATERLGVKVTDSNGFPVSNAVVRVGFSSGNIVFAKGKSHRYEALTDSQGKADVWFNGKSSDVGWSVSANGYYRSGPHTEVFKIAITQIPPMFYTVKCLSMRRMCR